METNRRLARIFDRIADFLEFKGDSPFRVNAYRRVARTIDNLSEDVGDIYRRGQVRDIPGIGEKIAAKIAQYFETGTIKKYEELRREIPEELVALLDVPNLGPKTLQLAYKELGVRSAEDLKRVIRDGALALLPGMGRKRVEKIEKGLKIFLRGQERMLLGEALQLSMRVLEHLKPFADQVTIAGSLRRMKETVGDLDVLAVGDKSIVIQEFVEMDGVVEVLARGETKASIMLDERQVDLRVMENEEWGASLQYFTGSKEHNVRLREIAKGKGLKINEYGVFSIDTNERVCGAEEEEVYRILGLDWIPPELREDRGEIEAGLEHHLPSLIGYDQVKGDLHVHSDWSDGTATLEELAHEAACLGYRYLAITDHSKSVKIANGLDERRIEDQIRAIRDLNVQKKGARLLAGTEVDIHIDGSLDLDSEVLKELDWVVASIHSHFSQDATERVVSACLSPWVNCIGHPTGRLIFSRDPYPIDLERVFTVASSTGTALEINAHQERLDLKDVHARRAQEMGVRLAIGTDAHHVRQLWMMRLGLGVARRGWIEARHVLNTYPVDEVLEFARKKR
jgi:DNA polymerase (family 10)